MSSVCVCVGGGEGPGNVFSRQCRQRAIRTIRTYLEKQLDPKGPIASQGGPVPVFLRKHIATCNFPKWSGPPVPPLDPPMNGSLNFELVLRMANGQIGISFMTKSQ